MNSYWKGSAPKEVRELISLSSRKGFKLVIHEDAPLTRLELLKSSENLTQVDAAKKYGISSVSVRGDTGTVQIDFVDAAPAPFPEGELRKIAGINCKFSYEENTGEWVNLAYNKV